MKDNFNAARGVVIAFGFMGTLVAFVGLVLLLGNGSIALPGLGIVSGRVVFVTGLLVTGATIAGDAMLFRQRIP